VNSQSKNSDALIEGIKEVRVLDRRAHAFARFLHRRIRQSDDREDGILGMLASSAWQWMKMTSTAGSGLFTVLHRSNDQDRAIWRARSFCFFPSVAVKLVQLGLLRPWVCTSIWFSSRRGRHVAPHGRVLPEHHCSIRSTCRADAAPRRRRVLSFCRGWPIAYSTQCRSATF
jgi:hypothetical protein